MRIRAVTGSAAWGPLGTAGRMAVLAALVTLLAYVRVRATVGAPRGIDPAIVVYGSVASGAYLIPGIVLLWRRRWHAVGWLLCFIAAGLGVAFASDWGAVWFGGPWMIWLLHAYVGSLFWFPIVALFVVFPDGLVRQTTGHQRLGRTLLTVASVMTLVELLQSEIGRPYDFAMPSPVGALAFIPPAVLGDGATTMVTASLVALAFGGLVARYRSAEAAARRQYRWVVWSFLLLIAAVGVALLASLLTGDADTSWWAGPLLAYLALPVAFMVAILRFRLYDIDRLVSRTVTYSVMVAGLGLVYTVAVGVFSQVLPMDNDVPVAASTLTAAALFRPLQRRVHRSVERRFNRTRFDAEQEFQGFTRTLRGQTDLQTVEAELREVVDRTLRPATLTVWIPGGPRAMRRNDPPV